MTKKTQLVKAEHLPPAKAGKASKPHDTEVARIAATNILHWHNQAESGARIALTAALMIGVTMERMKADLPHGSFIKWQDKYLKGIPLSTRARYLALARGVQKADESKYLTVRHLLPAKVQEVTKREIASISTQVGETLDGKHLSELYREYGLVRPRQTQDVKNTAQIKKRVGHTPANLDEEHMVSAAIWADELCTALERAEYISKWLTPETRRQVAQAIGEACEALGLGPTTASEEDG